MAKIEYKEWTERPDVRVAIAIDLAMAVSRAAGITPAAQTRCIVAAHRWHEAAADGDHEDGIGCILFDEMHGEFAQLFGVPGWNADDVGFDPIAFVAYPTDAYIAELLAGAEASTLNPHAPPSAW